jgi:hypothetical protein
MGTHWSGIKYRERMRDAHRCDQGSSAERGKERWKIKAEIFAKKEVEVGLP